MTVRFTQAEVTRALKAAKAAGYERIEVLILPDGAIKVSVADTAEEPESRGWGEGQ